MDDPAERAAYLERACGGDCGIRERIDALIAAHEQQTTKSEDPIMAKPAAVSARTLDETTAGSALPTSAVGERVSYERESPALTLLIGSMIAGRYILRQEIGEGGMGSIYQADQTQPVKRTVALKLIKPGTDSSAVLARFESERQAVALMDHPNIAKVLDAGTTEIKAFVPQTLTHWKTDSDLAGIRDEKELARLSDDERAAIQQLWNDVDQLIVKAAETTTRPGKVQAATGPLGR